MIEVIPGIVEDNWDKVENKISLLNGLSDWVHIDVSDGVFTPNTTWSNPNDLLGIKDINIEVHLMIGANYNNFNDWSQSSVRRIIIHWESFKGDELKIKEITRKIREQQKEVVLAFKPETQWKEAEQYVEYFDGVLILAVSPGYSGQEFDENVIKKIVSLKNSFPNINIEVDGGVKPALLEGLVKAGAERFVSTSYIFSNGGPEEKIKEYQEEIVKLNL